MQSINSIKDERVIQARTLATAAGRAKIEKCQLQGTEHIEWALATGLEIEHIFVSDTNSYADLIGQLEALHIPCFSVTDGIIKKITETTYLIPIVGIAPTKKREGQQLNTEMLVVLDHIQDHGNLGTIIRTAAAFGVNNIVTTDTITDFFFKKIIDASRGKVFSTRFTQYSNAKETIEALKKAGYQIVATSPHAKTLQSLVPVNKSKVALVLGNETNGISDDLMAAADTIVQIPMSSDVESLNVAVAGGLSIYEIKIRMILAMLTEKIRASFGRTVNVTSKLIQAAFDSYLKNITSLNATQVILLMILKCDEWMSIEQAVKDTQTHGTELELIITPLLQDGLLWRESRNNVAGIILTYKGEDFLSKIMLASEKLDSMMFKGFTEPERQLLNDFFGRIQENCLKIIENR